MLAYLFRRVLAAFFVRPHNGMGFAVATQK